MRAKKSKSEPTIEPTTPAWRVWADDTPLIGVIEVLFDDDGIKVDTEGCREGGVVAVVCVGVVKSRGGEWQRNGMYHGYRGRSQR
jgi:hypothetical protein